MLINYKLIQNLAVDSKFVIKNVSKILVKKHLKNLDSKSNVYVMLFFFNRSDLTIFSEIM